MPSWLVSVVVPVYNRPQELQRAVASALEQTYPVHEVIIVDDGSSIPITPETLGLHDQRVKIIRHDQNAGAAVARWTGIGHVTGELVAFLDSDDRWFPGKLSAQIETLDRSSGNLSMLGVVCGWEFEVGGTVGTRMPVAGSTLADFVSGCWYCPGSTLVIAKETFDIIGPFDPALRRLEDFEWFLRFAQAGGQIVSAPVIGAFISIGRRAGYRNVREASRKILSDFSSQGRSPLPSTVRRQLRAWLHVEQAAAARNDGQYLALIYHLAASLSLVPRRTIAIKNWFAAGEFDRA